MAAPGDPPKIQFSKGNVLHESDKHFGKEFPTISIENGANAGKTDLP